MENKCHHSQDEPFMIYLANNKNYIYCRGEIIPENGLTVCQLSSLYKGIIESIQSASETIRPKINNKTETGGICLLIFSIMAISIVAFILMMLN